MRNASGRRPALPLVAPPTLALALLVLVASAAITTASVIPRAQRAVEGSSSTSGEMDAPVATTVKVCHNSTPCGWAVYSPYTRTVQYFVRNTCECSRDRRCSRSEDDLSARAYVYRCMTPETTAPTPPAQQR